MTAFTRVPHWPLHRRLALVGAVAAGGLLLAGCGGNDDMKGMDHTGAKESATSKATAGSAAGAFNDADVSFAQMMIPHHEQALEMAGLADDRASNARIKSLAGQIEKAQDPEIVTLKSWLKGWGEPEKAFSDEMPGMNHGANGKSAMGGMMSEEDMRKLEAAKGPAFDRAFASMMIDHHKGAIAMAKDEKKNGRNAKAKKLADDVVKNQSTEVATLRTLLDRL
ncbi:DUF305 domain-containing protein [Streptomyces rapamycinicus]|uniref:DUF305 domain-containing protein n=2 Tax=Streptomyces rapamycinicus TaxID=1226757 RepID=A0A0A0N9F4_STRRN|nr:DUF305 domain-containing protein [Streptomyces rapamycinicus]AGP52733.1 hypothetical protein M271_05535 [Streptomyces rapamycinicus NRRL 5491]MBB4780208.1 uncharacterized protein (DUF305 family) [Streptomyces rapamycinicus]RLV75137.1 hypothetical protein D3C57_137965 [Streptomyces rapamycinicus NRRL 5491]UTO60946.1 DUF305 domain-containing protein [Streptomyces rapamycinicus]UTP28890.1 DUF305 domain-containing protein [Streptomyces rapamycinicus NRRL 5491]